MEAVKNGDAWIPLRFSCILFGEWKAPEDLKILQVILIH